MPPAAALNGVHNRDFAIQMAAHHKVCEACFLEDSRYAPVSPDLRACRC